MDLEESTGGVDWGKKPGLGSRLGLEAEGETGNQKGKLGRTGSQWLWGRQIGQGARGAGD